MYDHIIRNGIIIDGSGNLPYKGDIAVKGDQIVRINEAIDISSGGQIIDASGLIVTPGFIDIHDHSDFSLLIDRDAESALYQGITTKVIGNCGISCYPIATETKSLLESFIVANNHSRPLNWEDFDSYARQLEEGGLGVNVISLIGHGSLRIAVMGFEARPATKTEQENMGRLLSCAFDQGAFGLSSGLAYPPGVYAPAEELKALCGIVSKEGGLYASHLRGDLILAGPSLVDSLGEAIDVAKNTGVSLQVSHIAPKYPNNGVSKTVLDMMQGARNEGLEVTCDVHPYMAAMTFLAALLPPWVFEENPSKNKERLTGNVERTRILSDMKSRLSHVDWDEFWSKIEPMPIDPGYEFKGKRLNQIGKMIGKGPVEALLDILVDSGETLFDIFALMWIYSQEDTLKTLLWQYTMIGADGISTSKDSKIMSLGLHPRSWGTFPKVINQFHKQQKNIQLETIIYKMTGLPSSSLGLRDRGLIKEGLKADLAIFDLDRFSDKSTYTNPRQYSEGIEYLLVNGVLAIERGKLTCRRSGKVLRKR